MPRRPKNSRPNPYTFPPIAKGTGATTSYATDGSIFIQAQSTTFHITKDRLIHPLVAAGNATATFGSRQSHIHITCNRGTLSSFPQCTLCQKAKRILEISARDATRALPASERIQHPEFDVLRPVPAGQQFRRLQRFLVESVTKLRWEHPSMPLDQRPHEPQHGAGRTYGRSTQKSRLAQREPGAILQRFSMGPMDALAASSSADPNAHLGWIGLAR